MLERGAACPQCGSRLAVRAADGRILCPECQTPSGAPDTGASAEPADALIGRTLGEFEIVELIGRGGMGGVYKARQPSLDRFVAIKTLAPALARDADFVARFQREARTAAKLRHGNIVQVHVVGESEGVHYIAMEYVDGEGLDAIVSREGPLPQDRALSLLKEVCRALAIAHEAGVVHRDIKPSNILLDSRGEARVADFGLARPADSEAGPAGAGQSIGTPLYLAPEAAAGRAPDARADLYSLGGTFYALLAGRPPFVGGAPDELAARHATETPTPLCEAAPNVDPRLGQIIDGLLSKDPAERFPSARALLEALEALGHLKGPGAAARAEAEAMLSAAPTLWLSEAQRLERLAAAEALAQPARREPRPTRRAAVALAVGALLLGVALVVGIIVHKRLRDRASSKQPTTGTPGPAVVLMGERDAEALFREAQRAEAAGQWQTVRRALDQLRKEYADTQFYASNRIAIDELLAKADAELGPTRPSTKVPGKPPQPKPEGDWVSLFDGKTLRGWRGIENPRVEDGQIVFESANADTGVTWAGDFPTTNYEVAVEAARMTGDRFCRLHFPVGASHCSWVVGFWRGVTGLEDLDGRRYSANVTTRRVTIQQGQWYRLRVRVTDEKVEAWLDETKLVDVARAHHTLSMRGDFGRFQPFGLSVHSHGRTVARSIRMRRLKPEEPPPEPEGDWVSLFDGKTLDGWKVVDEFRPGVKPGKARVENGRIMLDEGDPITAIAWTGDFPESNYEVRVEARRVAGVKDFCTIVFPVDGAACRLVIGGWDAGTVVALEYVDGRPGAGNITTRHLAFEQGRWYRIALRVTSDRIGAWVDERQVIDFPRAGHRLSLHRGWTPIRPFGIGAWMAASELRSIRMRRLGPEPAPAPAPRLPEKPGVWAPLFDGNTLDGWRVVTEGQFGGDGRVRVEGGQVVLGPGGPRAGIAWTSDFPTVAYELAFEARRETEHAVLCDVLFPVGSSHCTLNLGGWDRPLVGLSTLDGRDAPDNDTISERPFETGRWYAVRLRVTDARVEAWCDDEKVVDLPTEGRRITPGEGTETLMPLGLATGSATTALRNIRMQRLEGKPEPAPADGEQLAEATVAVPGRANWFDTGLYLAKGQRYELSATGRWGHRHQCSHGPRGRAGADYPLPGAPEFALIGRIGPHGRPFEVGDRHAFEAAASGRLHLRMNDNIPTYDNWGCRRVTVQGQLVADKAAPLLSRFTRIVRQLDVGARDDWAFSGIELQRGDVYLITATGTWSAGPARRNLDPSGYDQTEHYARCGALNGRIGPHGELFAIGTLHLLEAREPGKLYLAMHDLDRNDNSGSVTVTIASAPSIEPHRRRPKPRPSLECRLLRTLTGHSDQVLAVAFTPDGARLASGSKDGTVRLWDTATGEARTPLRGHHGSVQAVAFSPEGDRIISAGADGSLRIWDAATGQCLKTLEGHGGSVASLAVFPDGSRIASGSDDTSIRIWDLPTGQWLGTMPDHRGCPNVAVSPDGQRLAAASTDGWLSIWDAIVADREHHVFAQNSKGWCAGFSPDGRRIVTGGYDPALKVWDAATAQRLASIDAPPGSQAAVFSPDGRWIASCGWFGTLQFWDAATHAYLATVKAHAGTAFSMAFSSDSKRLASGGWQGDIQIWAVAPADAARDEP